MPEQQLNYQIQQQLMNQQAANASASEMEIGALTGLATAVGKTKWDEVDDWMNPGGFADGED